MAGLAEPLLCYWCLLHGDSGQFGVREAATMVNGTAVCIKHIDRMTSERNVSSKG